MSQSLKRALFSALLVILVSYPILGLKLRTVGIKLEVLGADAQTLWTIAAAALAMFVWQLFRDRIPLKLGRGVGYKVNGSGLKNFLSLPSTQRWAVLALVVVAFVWPFFASRGAVDIATLILIYVMLGIGLNIVVGLAGLLDLGYVGFYAVGAYTYALLAEYAGFGFWTALPIAGMMAALFGFLLGFPVLRLRGDYLAIVTLGFGEIIRILLRNMTEITGGPNGIGSIPKPTLFGLTFERRAPEGMQTFHEFFGIAYNTNYKVIPALRGGPAAGAAGPVRDQPADAHADRSRLGSAARGRSGLPRSRSQPDHRQALRLHHRRQLRRFRRQLLRRPPGPGDA